MNTDVWESFETEFGPEPPLRSADVALAGGRRAVRRRRAVVGVGTLAAAAAVAAVVLGQLTDDPSASPAPAEDPGSSETPSVSAGQLAEQRLTEVVPVDTSWQRNCDGAAQPTCEAYQQELAPVGLRADGGLARAGEDVIVTQRYDIAGRSTGPVYVLELRTATSQALWWVVGRSPAGRPVVRGADPGRSEIDFETFARGLEAGRSPAGAPPLSRVTNPYGG